MGRRARWTAVVVLPAALLTGLAACSAPEQAQDAPAAVVVAAADCLSDRVLADLGLVAAGGSAQTGTPHPDAPQAAACPTTSSPWASSSARRAAPCTTRRGRGPR